MNHSEAVTKHRLIAKNTLDAGYWDEVYIEKPYFENYDKPIDNGNVPNKGRMVGECDLLFVNFDDEIVLYKELKSSRKALSKGYKQTDRFEEFFEESDWDTLSTVVLEE